MGSLWVQFSSKIYSYIGSLNFHIFKNVTLWRTWTLGTWSGLGVGTCVDLRNWLLDSPLPMTWNFHLLMKDWIWDLSFHLLDLRWYLTLDLPIFSWLGTCLSQRRTVDMLVLMWNFFSAGLDLYSSLLGDLLTLCWDLTFNFLERDLWPLELAHFDEGLDRFTT